jgi:hypothetical protein
MALPSGRRSGTEKAERRCDLCGVEIVDVAHEGYEYLVFAKRVGGKGVIVADWLIICKACLFESLGGLRMRHD